MKKVTKSKSKILKFIDAKDGAAVYISPAQVAALKQVKQNYYDPNNPVVTTSATSYDYTPAQTQCIIYLNSGMHFNVTEHIAVVTAMLKGEDPAPAEVIFGTE